MAFAGHAHTEFRAVVTLGLLDVGNDAVAVAATAARTFRQGRRSSVDDAVKVRPTVDQHRDLAL